MRTLPVIVSTLAAALPVSARDHFEIIIAQNSAGQLQVHADFPQPIALPPSIFPGYLGYAAALPGFASLDFDEPGEDLYTLSLASSPVFILISADPGVRVWNGTTPKTPGQPYTLGTPPFDNHPVWQIPSAEPGRVYSIQLYLHDAAGIHSDSEIVTFDFAAHCHPNCDASTTAPILNVNDFSCFLNAFAAGDSLANCDGSTAEPTLNVSDFVCFLNAFAAGCP